MPSSDSVSLPVILPQFLISSMAPATTTAATTRIMMVFVFMALFF